MKSLKQILESTQRLQIQTEDGTSYYPNKEIAIMQGVDFSNFFGPMVGSTPEGLDCLRYESKDIYLSH